MKAPKPKIVLKSAYICYRLSKQYPEVLVRHSYHGSCTFNIIANRCKPTHNDVQLILKNKKCSINQNKFQNLMELYKCLIYPANKELYLNFEPAATTQEATSDAEIISDDNSCDGE